MLIDQLARAVLLAQSVKIKNRNVVNLLLQRCNGSIECHEFLLFVKRIRCENIVKGVVERVDDDFGVVVRSKMNQCMFQKAQTLLIIGFKKADVQYENEHIFRYGGIELRDNGIEWIVRDFIRF